MESMIYLLTFYIRGGCRPREEEMYSCLTFPFIPGCLFPESSVPFFCLLFTRGSEICSFMCLVLCSSATGCEAIYLFVLCSWPPLNGHVQKREEKHILFISSSHILQKLGPRYKEKRAVPVCFTEGCSDSSQTVLSKDIICKTDRCFNVNDWKVSLFFRALLMLSTIGTD